MTKVSKQAKLTVKKLKFQSSDKIFIGHHLGKNSFELLNHAKALKAEGKIMSTWTTCEKIRNIESQKNIEEEQLSEFIEILHDPEPNKISTRTLRTKK